MALPNEPITRREMYLSNIAGQNTPLPDAPITREEMYLDYIAKNGGTGEGDMKKSIYDSDNSVATAGGIKMFVNQKIGTLPQRVGSLETTAGVLQGEVVSIENTLGNLGTASTKNSTSVVTSSSDLVESGAVYDAIDASVGFVTTGKNKLWFTLESLKSTNTVGTWSGNTYSHKGVTFTVNDDGTITANGTVNTSGHANFEIAIPSDLYGDLKYNGARDGTTNKYDTFMWDYQTNARCNQWDGVTSCLSGYADLEEVKIIQGHYTRFICRIFNGFTANNVKFYPMITDASEVNPTYEPYHASVEESLAEKCDNSVIAPVENGSTASQAYAVGEHFIRDGTFCTCKQAISQGGSFTLNTNYTAGDVAGCLVKQDTFNVTTSANGNAIITSDSTKNVLKVKTTGAVSAMLYNTENGTEAHFVNIPSLTSLASTEVSGTYYYI